MVAMAMLQCTYEVMCSGGGGCRHKSVPGDVMAKSGKMGGEPVTSLTGALAGTAARSVPSWWMKTPCVAAGGGACSGSDMAGLLTVVETGGGPAAAGGGGGAWRLGLGSGVSGGAGAANCGGAAAMKTGAPVAASDDKITGSAAVSGALPAAGGDAIMPGIPAAPAIHTVDR